MERKWSKRAEKYVQKEVLTDTKVTERAPPPLYRYFHEQAIFLLAISKESRKKCFLLMAGPLRGGEGVKARAIKEKITFFGTFFSNVPKFQRPLSSRGGGRLGLNGPAIKSRTFFGGFPKRTIPLIMFYRASLVCFSFSCDPNLSF